MDTLYEKKIRFTFEDGPLAGKSFDHIYHADGTAEWNAPGSSGAPTVASKSAVAKLNDRVYVTSYLESRGYTLTVVLDMNSKRLIAFASNGTDWYQQKGTFEIV